MSYIIAIPSYNRAETIKHKTLQLLKEIPAHQIYIFVSSKDQKSEYELSLGDHEYNIVVGVKGITAQRNFIMDYFPLGTHIVSIDDDVDSLLSLSKEGEMVRFPNVHDFITRAFQDLSSYNLSLFGIYPTPNAFFLKNQPSVTTSLKFIIGGFYGFVNKRMHVHPKEKEDVHFTILNFMADKGVLRYNHISYKTKFKATGGLGPIENRFDSNKTAAEFLASNYPQYARIKIRKSGMYEIMLREFKTQKTLKRFCE